MKRLTRLTGLMLLAGLCCAQGQAQQGNIRIDGRSSDSKAMPGQLVQLLVEGIRVRVTAPAPLERFEVFVTQDDATHTARVREVTPITLAKPPGESAAAMSDQPPVATAEAAATKTALTFTLPAGLHEGDATVVVSYRGERSDVFALKVVSNPPTPHIAVPFVTGSLTSGRPPKLPDDLKERARQAGRLERGSEAMLLVRPLVDPDAADVAVLVTFKQENFQRDMVASIINHEPVEQEGGVITFGARRYEVRVRVPADLGVGPAEVEARLRVNGVVSDVGKTTVQITDGFVGNPTDSAPHINNFMPEKIGIGQAVHLFVEDPRHLQPDPDKVLVVLEQNGRRVELKPEQNTARYGIAAHRSLVSLTVRVGQEITGKATLRVVHPLRGDSGVSEPVTVEIVGEVLAPEVIRVTEAAKQDIAQLSAMREQMEKVGRTFKEYDPKYRYVTIRARGLDYNPNYTRIVFQQEGRNYTLQYADYSLWMGDRTVVRLPEAIRPGEVTVTIQNRGAERLSAPVVRTFEVTEPSKQ